MKITESGEDASGNDRNCQDKNLDFYFYLSDLIFFVQKRRMGWLQCKSDYSPLCLCVFLCVCVCMLGDVGLQRCRSSANLPKNNSFRLEQG